MLKRLSKWLFRLLLLGLAFFVAFVLLVDSMARALTERELRRRTGLDLRIGKMEVGLWYSTLRLENIVVYNSAAFGGSPFLILPELYCEYRSDQLLNRAIHMTLLRLQFAEINIVEGRDGKLNIRHFQEAVAGLAAREAVADRGKSSRKPVVEFQGIDTLNLSMGKIKFSSLKTPATTGEFNLNLQHHIVNGVRTTADLERMLGDIAARKGLSLLWQHGFQKTNNP